VGWGLTVRGAWGKSFRAPGFGQLSQYSGSRAIGANQIGGSGDNDYTFDCTNTGTGQAAGTALPGSATAILNPTCSSNVSIYAPAGINLQGGSGLGDYARGLTGAVATANPLTRGKGLSPETSKQYNVGFNFAPTEGFLQGLNLDVSFWQIKLLDSIRADPTGSNSGIHIGDNPLARHLFTIRPSRVSPGADDSSFDAILKNLASLPSSTSTFVLQNGNQSELGGRYDFIFDGANSNVAGYNLIKGLDFSFRYDWDMGNWGSFNVGTATFFLIDNCSWTGADDSPVTCEKGYEDLNGNKVGQNSGAQLQKVRSRLGWMHPDGTWSATLFNTWQGHQPPTTNITYPECFWADGYGPGACYPGSPYYPQPYDAFYNSSPGWMQWDLNITYNTGMMPTNEYLQGLNISLTINNVLDASPPQVFNSRSNAREIYARDSRWNELGRFVSLQVTKNW